MKKRHTRAEIEAILQRRERDGLTYSELSERTGVAPSTLAWWSWRRRREGKPRVRTEPQMFAQVVEVEDRRPPESSLELVTASGTTLRIPVGFDATSLERVLTVLQGQC